MKIQFIFLVVCVVASFALPQRNDFANREQEQREQDDDEQQELENTNQGSASVDDQLIDVRDENLDEKTNSSNETVTERTKGRNQLWRRHNRRYWLRRAEQRRRDKSGAELSDERRRDPSIRPESESLAPEDNHGTEVGHHRHHHRHHHHHKNRTTTTPPPPPSTTSTALTSERQLSELEEIAAYRHLTPY